MSGIKKSITATLALGVSKCLEAVLLTIECFLMRAFFFKRTKSLVWILLNSLTNKIVFADMTAQSQFNFRIGLSM